MTGSLTLWLRAAPGVLRLRRRAIVAASLAAIAVVPAMTAASPAALAAGTTLYVDGSSLTCSDLGSGTQSAPYCTIGAAGAATTAGTSVVVNSGTYPENVNVGHSGVQGSPITFAPAAAATVTISGQLHGFTVTNQSWITISGFNITATSNYGIYLSNSAHIILNGNHVSYTGQPVSGQMAAGIHLGATTDSLIENNTVDHTTWAGIELYSSSVRDEVRGNIVSNSAAGWERAAVGIDVESASATVDYNVIHDNEDSGIQFYTGGDSGIAFDNVSYNNGDHGIDSHNVTGVVVTGNSVYHNCTTGINVEGTSSSITVENNLAVDNAVYPAYNGISCSRGTGNIGVSSSVSASTTADYNLVNLTTSGDLYVWAGTTYSSIAALHTATGQEAHGIGADPKWVNSAGADFHLQPGSPAIDSANAGAPAQPSVDIGGNPRADDPATPNTGAGPREYDDRGAYEFQPTVSDTQPPSVPTGLAATASSSKPLQVHLSWNGSTDSIDGVTGYTVYRGGSVLAEVSGTTVTYTDTAVVDATNYTYAVDAFDASGNHSAHSAPASATTPDLTAPSVPTSLSAIGSAIPLQVKLSWNASTDNVGVTGYTVYRDGSSIGTAAGTTYTDTTVSGLTTYTYTVDAFDAALNHSAQSVPVSVNTSDVTPPSVPTNLSATAASSPSVVLNWKPSTDNVGVTGYTIYRGGIEIGTVPGGMLTYTDTTVVGSTTYSYTVDAFDAAGNHSGQSSAASVTTPVVWTSLGGILTSAAAVASSGTTRTDVFVRGTDNALYQRTWNGTSWSAWTSLGGILTSSPSAISWGPNRIDVFVRGTDNGLYQRTWNGTAWSPWVALGGILTSGPGTASWAAGHLDVFVRGTDNGLYQRTWNGTSWSPWVALGGILTSDPAAVSWGSNRIDVFVRGTDNGLYQRSWTGSAWSAWQRHGGVLTSGIGAASCTSGHLDVYVLGTDAAIYHMAYNGTWSTWQRQSGTWTASPSAVCVPGSSIISMFERGTDHALWQSNQSGT